MAFCCSFLLCSCQILLFQQIKTEWGLLLCATSCFCFACGIPWVEEALYDKPIRSHRTTAGLQQQSPWSRCREAQLSPWAPLMHSLLHPCHHKDLGPALPSGFYHFLQTFQSPTSHTPLPEVTFDYSLCPMSHSSRAGSLFPPCCLDSILTLSPCFLSMDTYFYLLGV